MNDAFRSTLRSAGFVGPVFAGLMLLAGAVCLSLAAPSGANPSGWVNFQYFADADLVARVEWSYDGRNAIEGQHLTLMDLVAKKILPCDVDETYRLVHIDRNRHAFFFRQIPIGDSTSLAGEVKDVQWIVLDLDENQILKNRTVRIRGFRSIHFLRGQVLLWINDNGLIYQDLSDRSSRAERLVAFDRFDSRHVIQDLSAASHENPEGYFGVHGPTFPSGYEFHLLRLDEANVPRMIASWPIRDQRDYHIERVGDAVVMFSDGVVESRQIHSGELIHQFAAVSSTHSRLGETVLSKGLLATSESPAFATGNRYYDIDAQRWLASTIDHQAVQTKNHLRREAVFWRMSDGVTLEWYDLATERLIRTVPYESNGHPAIQDDGQLLLCSSETFFRVSRYAPDPAARPLVIAPFAWIVWASLSVGVGWLCFLFYWFWISAKQGYSPWWDVGITLTFPIVVSAVRVYKTGGDASEDYSLMVLFASCLTAISFSVLAMSVHSSHLVRGSLLPVSLIASTTLYLSLRADEYMAGTFFCWLVLHTLVFLPLALLLSESRHLLRNGPTRAETKRVSWHQIRLGDLLIATLICSAFFASLPNLWDSIYDTVTSALFFVFPVASSISIALLMIIMLCAKRWIDVPLGIATVLCMVYLFHSAKDAFSLQPMDDRFNLIAPMVWSSAAITVLALIPLRLRGWKIRFIDRHQHELCQ